MTRTILALISRRFALLLALIVGATIFSVAPAQAYQPGDAIPSRPRYLPVTGHWNYECEFPGWRSGAKVIAHCELWSHTRSGWVLLESLKRTWTPPPSQRGIVATEPVNMGGGITLCTRARAHSVDGGVVSDMKCYFV